MLRNARLPGIEGLVDIGIEGGRVASIAAAGGGSGGHDCDGGLVFPCFVDLHTHLDKGQIWERRGNPDGTHGGALGAVKADREANWTAADVERRMEFSLRCAYAHGTAAIRTHLDSAPPQHSITWPVFERVRARWAGRIELQGVALIGPDQLLDPVVLEAVAGTAKAAGGLLGGSIAVHPRAEAAVRAAVDAAGRHGLDLDLHVDETGDPAARCLRALAEAVIESGFGGRVVAGHCCSLAVQDAGFAAATIDRVARAGIAVVSLPMCNMFLQDRVAGRTPRWRGVTLVQELDRAGVSVCLASDNTRDPFYAYGDLDALEVLREGVRIAQLEYPSGFGWVPAVTSRAASVGGFGYRGAVTVGDSADLVLFRARSWTALMARPQSDRIVLRAGVRVETGLPDDRELDRS